MIVLLTVALVAAVGALGYYLFQLTQANARIADQQQQIEEQQHLIDQKEVFGSAMNDLLETATAFDGTPFAAIVPLDAYDRIAAAAWSSRWNSAELDLVIGDARAEATHLEGLLATASAQVATNSSGTKNEAVIDKLGAGFVASLIDDADTLCDSDVLACVMSDDPYTVHFDAADISLPYMTDWLRTGLSYHEFAHVLQMTNPDPTAIALEAFDGDTETMADCFALTYLDGWTLDHTVWVNSYQYYEVSIGYGYTCNSTQRQAVRDWHGQLGYQPRTVSQ